MCGQMMAVRVCVRISVYTCLYRGPWGPNETRKVSQQINA